LTIEVKLFDCKPASQPVPVAIPISGNISANSFTFRFVIDIPGGPLGGGGTGSVSGTAMTVSFSGADANGTATLTQTSSAPPESALSGSYSGTYSAVIVPCGKLPPVSFSGTLSAILTQSGSSISGPLTGTGFKSDHENVGICTLVDDTDPRAFITAQINGPIIVGVILLGQDDVNPFVGQIYGTTITGHVDGEFPGEKVDFTISRTSTSLPPAILFFDADPSTINAGQSSKLSWSTVNAAVSIDNGIGAQPAVGSVTVRPATTTTYTLTASGAGAPATARVTVTVATAAPARIGVAAHPRGMVQATGQAGATDSFALANVGGTAADVTLSTSGGFFTIAPTSFTLGPNTTQRVIVTALAQPTSGFLEGSVSVSGTAIAIPIRLLSATPPGENAQVSPAAARAEVQSSAGQNPSGSVNFTNRGTRPLPAIAVSDQPWIVPQSGVITIQPGEAKSIAFTIDSSKRPDAASPLGGVTAKLSLVFPTGSGAGKSALAGTPSGSVSVTVVYVVAPGATPGSPPPLGAGEVALFVPGLGNKAKAVGDLLIANKQSSAPVTDLRLYSQNQFVSLPQIAPNAAAAFPGLLKNVLPSSAQSGTAQIRGGDLSKISVAAVQLNTSSSSGTFGTALPVLRSDRSISSGARMILSGVLKQQGVQTDLYVQELTGNPATVQIDFLGESGAVISSRAPDSIAGFGTLEILDAVPANAMAARITNTSSGAAKINAFGLVQSVNSGDSWVVTDPAVNGAPSDDTFIVPILNAGSGATTVFYATNRTSSSASVTVDTRSAPNKRRVVTHAVGGLAVSTFTLAPFESLFAPSISSTTSFIRFSSTAGAMSVNARSVRVGGENAFGSGLPALPLSSAIGGGDLKRFAGVEDALSSDPGTFRTNLVLVETSNQAATVKLTLRYTFIAGGLVSANAVSSKEYALSASQFLVINNVAGDVIGSQRDAFGDLHNMELDVEVTGGSGRVLPFLQTIDNGSGDMVVRTD
jgi:hypothetical protein